MKYMAWGPDDYAACPLSLRDEIIVVMNEEAEQLAEIRNR